MAIIKCFDKKGGVHEVEESECIFRKSVYGCYINSGRVLMIKELHVGRWELPGGGVDKGESDEEALLREVKEETGLTAKKVVKQIHSDKSYYFDLGTNRAFDSERSWYEVEVDEDGELLVDGNGHDVAGAKFIKLDQIEDSNIGEQDLKVIKMQSSD